MKHDHFVVQSPDKPAQQLLLLFHGVGDNPVAMGEIGSVCAAVSGCANRQHWRGRALWYNFRASVVFGTGGNGREPPGAY